MGENLHIDVRVVMREVLQSPVPFSVVTNLDLIQISRGVGYHMSVHCGMTEDWSECH